MKYLSLILMLIFFSLNAFAQIDNNTKKNKAIYTQREKTQIIDNLFHDIFYESYSFGGCYFNVSRFFSKMENAGIPTENFRFVQIVPRNPQVSDLIAVSNERNTNGIPSPFVFNYHIVAMEKLKNGNYRVYDFDFGNTPKPISLRKYIDKMFNFPERVDAKIFKRQNIPQDLLNNNRITSQLKNYLVVFDIFSSRFTDRKTTLEILYRQSRGEKNVRDVANPDELPETVPPNSDLNGF